MIRFSKYIWLYFFLSACVLVPGIFSLVTQGFKPSIDFTGGSLIELSGTGITKNEVDSRIAAQDISVVSVQETNTGSFVIRAKAEESQKLASMAASFSTSTSSGAAILRNEIVGPILGQELLEKAFVAALLSIIGILLYVAYTFKNITFGVSAVVALFHDLLVVLGLFSLFGVFLNVEVDTLFVTAFLTTMSFSVHDTIVVFDRIREMQKKGEKGTFEELVDKSLTQTMSRSLANSVTIIIMLLALVLLGGSSIYWFAMALLIGTVSGTYSSPFVAAPVLILLKRWQSKRKKR